MCPRAAALSCTLLVAVLLAGEARAGGERRRPGRAQQEAAGTWVPGGHDRPSLSVGAEAQGFGMDGGAVGAHARMEGRLWGVEARVAALVLDDEDALVMDELLEVHLTYTLLGLPRARLRLSAGMDSMHAPGVSVYGPGVGMSLEACVAGPLDLELRGSVTPFPFRQVDAQAGLALQLGALGLRGGVRGLYLDDDGLADGLRSEVRLAGPYLGLALTF